MIGVIGVLVRRNIIIIFMSIELILNAVNINLVAPQPVAPRGGPGVRGLRHRGGGGGDCVGLGIILAFYRNKETVNIDEMNLMRW
jgi:NADH-quinone oxidoreductase subunit K